MKNYKNKDSRLRLHTSKIVIMGIFVAVSLVFAKSSVASAMPVVPRAAIVAKTDVPLGGITDPDIETGGYCGGMSSDGETNNRIRTAINIGCKGKGNPILDALFAVVRFLTLGVGLVLIASTIVAGIQYTTSRGDPQATAKALGRITSTVGALLFFIFIYAILNWVVPNGILK